MKNISFIILIYKFLNVWSSCFLEKNNNTTAVSDAINIGNFCETENEKADTIPDIITLETDGGELDTYRIHYIDEGSSANVYKGKNFQKNETFALKLYPKDDKNGFENEKEIYKLLKSEYIPKIYGTARYAEKYKVLILEYFECTLYDYFKKNLVKNLEMFVIIKHILFGLRLLHDNEIIHNDLKSNNIFIVEDLQIKIIDFGLSCTENNLYFIFEDYNPKEINQYTYISPEVRNSISYTTKADIWSLGSLIKDIVSYLCPKYFSKIDLEYITKIICACHSNDFMQRPSAKSLSYCSIFDIMYPFLDILKNESIEKLIFSSFMFFIKDKNKITFCFNLRRIYLYCIKSSSNQHTIDQKLFGYLDDHKFLKSVFKDKHIFLSQYRFFFISIDNSNLFSVMDLDYRTLIMVEEFCKNFALLLESPISTVNLFQGIYQNIQKLEENKIFKILKKELEQD
ncbi:protein kinase [Hamiltosporidium magnivora]|uniref:Protein kinase n=1 Tax=Hamiltosporidium magnivora TaxID=148818 RepID=A0A4Q9LMT6_9MICR|nr:protein kinase [Hamiltosporidium magnivora]